MWAHISIHLDDSDLITVHDGDNSTVAIAVIGRAMVVGTHKQLQHVADEINAYLARKEESNGESI